MPLDVASRIASSTAWPCDPDGTPHASRSESKAATVASISEASMKDCHAEDRGDGGMDDSATPNRVPKMPSALKKEFYKSLAQHWAQDWARDWREKRK